MKKGRPSEVLREHKAIVKALSEGDVQGTKNAVETHLVNSKLAALESFREVVEE